MERVQREREREGIRVDANGSPSTAREGGGPSRTVVSEEERQGHVSGPVTDGHEEIHHTQTENPSQSDFGTQETKTKAPVISNISMSALERNGLCVVCQDEEANIAIVDCGHMAMCRNCSDLIMTSSKECPLCRTRIVTEARLLRIFKS